LLGGEGNLVQSETAVSINDQMPRYAAEFLERRYIDGIAGKKVLLLGVSYRGDVGDTRFSPVEPFYRCLIQAGACVSAHDPYVTSWSEIGIRTFMNISDAFSTTPDIVVISSGHRLYREDATIDLLFSQYPLWVYDTIGLLSAGQIKRLQEKHKVIVLGRGDI
jgi:UDP-N-acetyl-D-mannosaminuronate dehydrogenase